MRINTNASSIVAIKTQESGNTRLGASLNRLATARRVNSGRDDPAALISGAELQAQITTLEAAVEGNERTERMLNTADSALAQISDVLSDARGLAVASANSGAMSPAEIQANQAMIDGAVNAVDRIASTTSFAGRKLFDGSVTVQVSPDGHDTLTVPAISSGTLGATGGGTDQSLSSITSSGANSVSGGHAATAVAILTKASSQITDLRARIGAFQKNGLEASVNMLSDATVNLAAARSQMIDTDFAAEAANLARQLILVQSGTSVLSVAVQQPQRVLRLLS